MASEEEEEALVVSEMLNILPTPRPSQEEVSGVSDDGAESWLSGEEEAEALAGDRTGDGIGGNNDGPVLPASADTLAPLSPLPPNKFSHLGEADWFLSLFDLAPTIFRFCCSRLDMTTAAGAADDAPPVPRALVRAISAPIVSTMRLASAYSGPPLAASAPDLLLAASNSSSSAAAGVLW